jgi:hypothetical protein
MASSKFISSIIKLGFGFIVFGGDATAFTLDIDLFDELVFTLGIELFDELVFLVLLPPFLQ